MTDVRAIVLRAAGINCDMETEYALELANLFSQFYRNCRVIGDEKETQRLLLVELFKQAMGSAMGLLGISKIERM